MDDITVYGESFDECFNQKFFITSEEEILLTSFGQIHQS